MTAPTPARVRDALISAGCRVQLEAGWDDPRIGKYGSGWQPTGVVLHHTANSGTLGDAPSLGWVLHNQYDPVRACHLLISRSGVVHLVYALGCYHAGMGGPMTVGGTSIPQDMGNAYLYGIEIESKGTNASMTAAESTADGITPAQVDATTRAAAALVQLLGKNETAVIRHRDWAPGRKNDVLQPLSTWRDLIRARLQGSTPTPTPTPTPESKGDGTMFVAEVKYGTNNTSWWLVGPNGTVSLRTADAATWNGPRLRVSDESEWRLILARYPQ